MIKHNQNGSAAMVVSLALCAVLLLVAIVFGAWAFSSRQDYKNNADVKIQAAVTIAKQQESTVKDQQFAEASKSPLTTYNGPQQYGSVVVKYPKTWSGYVDDTGQGASLIDGYFAQGVVPSISDQNSVFALRVQVLSQPYDQTLQSFQSQQEAGQLSAKAYALPKVPKAVGVELNGQVNDQFTGTMVVVPLRSNTLEIYTEGTQYLNDFNNYILPNFSFSP